MFIPFVTQCMTIVNKCEMKDNKFLSLKTLAKVKKKTVHISQAFIICIKTKKVIYLFILNL